MADGHGLASEGPVRLCDQHVLEMGAVQALSQGHEVLL